MVIECEKIMTKHDVPEYHPEIVVFNVEAYGIPHFLDQLRLPLRLQGLQALVHRRGRGVSSWKESKLSQL